MGSVERVRLLRAIAMARLWLNELITGVIPDIGALAARERKSERSVRMTLSLAFLDPRWSKPPLKAGYRAAMACPASSIFPQISRINGGRWVSSGRPELFDPCLKDHFHSLFGLDARISAPQRGDPRQIEPVSNAFEPVSALGQPEQARKMKFAAKRPGWILGREVLKRRL